MQIFFEAPLDGQELFREVAKGTHPMSVRPTKGIERPAVFFVNGFGDQLVALPAMRALGQIFPGGMQLLLGEGMLSFFYRGLPTREAVRVWWADSEKGRIDVDRIAATTESCDHFICLATAVSDSVLELARRMGASRTMGFFEMFNDYVPFDHSLHMFDQFFSMPQRFRPDLRFDDFSFAPSFSPSAETAAERFIRKRVAPGQPILFVHPETLTYKMWSPLSFSWVLERFLDAHTEYTVFLASVLRYPLVLERHQHRIMRIDEHLELVLAILKHADIFLGIDSCLLHAADLLRVPGVGLFGPTDPRRWGFRLSDQARSIWGEGSMEAIRREVVLDALLETAEGVQPRGEPALCEVGHNDN